MLYFYKQFELKKTFTLSYLIYECVSVLVDISFASFAFEPEQTASSRNQSPVVSATLSLPSSFKLPTDVIIVQIERGRLAVEKERL